MSRGMNWQNVQPYGVLWGCKPVLNNFISNLFSRCSLDSLCWSLFNVQCSSSTRESACTVVQPLWYKTYEIFMLLNESWPPWQLCFVVFSLSLTLPSLLCLVVQATVSESISSFTLPAAPLSQCFVQAPLLTDSPRGEEGRRAQPWASRRLCVTGINLITA